MRARMSLETSLKGPDVSFPAMSDREKANPPAGGGHGDTPPSTRPWQPTTFQHGTATSL